MTIFERRQRLLDILRKEPGSRVPEMADALGVSEGTVRNDLNALEEDGLLERVRGGAILAEDVPVRSLSFLSRLKQNADAKQAIGRQAARLVEDGDSILLDASTTVYFIARFLQNRRKLRVITNGIEIARLLAQNPTNTVIVLGGVLNSDSTSITGLISEQMVQDLHVKTAFVSCSGITTETGLTEVHIAEAQLKEKALTAAKKVIALVDSSKFDKVDLTSFARLDQVDHLFTDDRLSQNWIERLKQNCQCFTVCGEDNAITYAPCQEQDGHYRIGFANLSEESPFAVDVRKGLEQAAREAGNVELILADNRLDPETAVQVARQFLDQDLDLVIEYQIDEQTGSRIINLFQNAEIPVIAVDIPMVGATYFGVDNYRAGHMAGVAMGKWLLKYWEGQFDYLVILDEPRAGALPAARIQGQLDGLQSVLGPVPQDKQVVRHSGNTRETSLQVMNTVLANLPKTSQIAVLSFNDDAAIGALEAARHQNLEDQIVIVGQGADRRVREELSQPGCRIIGSTTYSPEKYGEKLVPLALRILRGESVPPAVYIEHTFVEAISEANETNTALDPQQPARV
ncbi:MAG: substrate-binding domain-containing protein [Anaerolineales bacterium]